MEEQLVSFETAILAKEKGFDERVPFFYTEESGLYRFSECEMFYGLLSKEDDADHYIQNSSKFSVWDKQNKVDIPNKVEYNSKTMVTVKCTAPTQSLLQKWLRETYNIKVFVIPNFESVNIMKDSNKIVTGYYDIYKILPYFFEAIIFVKDKNRFYSTSHDTYEKALETGLIEALNLINTK